MKLSELENQIVDHYDEDDAGFARWAIKQISDHFAAMKPSTSKIDPERLGSQSVLYSKIKQRCLEKVGPMEVEGRETGMKSFNAMDIKQQLRFQALASQAGSPKWAIAIQILPKNLETFVPPGKLKLKEVRAAVDKGKLQAEMKEIDGDRLLEKLMPNLTSTSGRNKRHAIAAAVMLATGRRTTEVLWSGKLYLDQDQTMDGYACMFSGQLKTGLAGDQPYAIPLLAPYAVVKAAWDRVRNLYPTDGLNAEEVNQAYASALNHYCDRTFGLNPHSLRACYALMTFALQPKKMSLIGWIGKVLGHSQPSAASYYQRMKIVNFTGPWKVDLSEIQVDENSDWGGWVLEGAAEEKRLQGLLELQEKRIPISTTAIRDKVGGTMAVAMRIVERNKTLIAEYNASLE